MSVYMEGSLYKWTNYYLGWQSRWFVLNDGTLSYYLSSSQVSEGSRGSVKISSCNITAHPKDKRRIDVIIRGEMYMYLRTASETERQKWLVVLGSAKLHEEPAAAQGSGVKSRMILLHTNCQLLVSQIAALKSAIAQKELMNDSSLDELSTGISTSCDEFLNILAECMDLNYEDSVWPAHLKPLSAKAAGSPLLGLSPRQKIMTPSDRKEGPFLSSTQSPTPFQFPGPRPLSPPNVALPFHLQHPPKRSERQYPIPQRQDPIPQGQDPIPQRQDPIPPRQDPIPQRQDPIPQANSDLFLTPTSSPANTPPPSPKPQIVTFFAKLPQKFGDIQLTATNEIPTVDFLNCCRVALPFFDLLSPTAFAPVKTDINGNIEKLNKKYQSNTLRYHTLQSMVLEEFNAGSQNARNSATDALLWLKRAMEFVQVFLMEVADGEKSLDIAAGKAYSQSLRSHHNWIVIGIFNLAVKAVPYHGDFLKLLGSDLTQIGNNKVLRDMKEFTVGLKQMIVLIKQFYELHGLNV